MTQVPSSPTNEQRLIRILVIVDWHDRVALVHPVRAKETSDREYRSTISAASLALAKSLDLPSTREFFGGPDTLDDFSGWEFADDMDEATHAFVFEVSKPLATPDQYVLDFDVVVGDSEDAFPDLMAASSMLARFIDSLMSMG